MNWKLSYSLDSESYAPLQSGKLTNIQVKNLTSKRMVINNFVFKFDWMGTYRWTRSCNIKIPPKRSAILQDFGFTIEFATTKGSHNYKAGITYQLLDNDSWTPAVEEYEPNGDFIEIKPLPKKDYTIFVSHSNSAEDKKMVSECKEAMIVCGITGYFAEDDTNPSGILWEKITKNIKKADAVLVIWSKNASKSGDVREEIGITIGCDKATQIISIVENGVDVQGSLKNFGTEWIDYKVPNHMHSIEAALQKIMEWATLKEKQKTFIGTPPKKLDRKK